jgi:hypothetical protein
MWPFRRKYEGLEVVGWGPFPLPGEKKRMRRAQEKAAEMRKALDELRERDERSQRDA